LHDKSKGERGIVRVDGVCACALAKREEGRRDLCHHYTNISLDREKPSRSPTLVIDIIARYDELAKRS
jgi:hypothetical protein